MAELRVLTYNVRSLRDDGVAVADVIRACRPDVVLVQEAPRFLRWRSKRAALARRSGLVVATADRVGGLLVLTSIGVRVRRTAHTLLPKTPRLHQRAVCVADVEIARGRSLRLASVHLSLDADERARHLPSIWAALDADRGGLPLVVAGDVNEGPNRPVWRELAARLTDAYAAAGAGDGDTYSTRNRRKRIDGVFVDPALEVVECRVVTDLPDTATVARASDHFPVLAVIRIP